MRNNEIMTSKIQNLVISLIIIFFDIDKILHTHETNLMTPLYKMFRHLMSNARQYLVKINYVTLCAV